MGVSVGGSSPPAPPTFRADIQKQGNRLLYGFLEIYMHFENREEAIKFQERIDSYVRSREQSPIWHYSLEIAYDICCIRWNAQIFSALVDLRINSMLVSCDLTEVHHHWRKIDQKVSAPQQYLDDDSIFAVRMQIHHLLSGVVLRYRALWDKFFKFLLMFPFQSPRTKEESMLLDTL